jgi:hypothetical protein
MRGLEKEWTLGKIKEEELAGRWIVIVEAVTFGIVIEGDISLCVILERIKTQRKEEKKEVMRNWS